MNAGPKMPRELVSEDVAKERFLLFYFGDHLERPDRFVPFVDSAFMFLEKRDRDVLLKRFSGMSYKAIGKETENRTKKDGSGVSGSYAKFLIDRAIRRLNRPRIKRKVRRRLLGRTLTYTNSYYGIPDWFLSEEEKKTNDGKNVFVKKRMFDPRVIKQASIVEDVSLLNLGLGFYDRTRWLLHKNGLFTFSDLIKKTEIDLYKIPEFGRKTVMNIKDVLSTRGLRLKGDGDELNADRLAELCKDQVDFTGKCQDCDCEVKVTIKRTDEGFLVTGGAVYEPTRDKFYLKCDECFEREPVLKNFQSCLVFSRIVGYLTPINQWNDGKKAEFSIRKTFNLEKALS